MASKDDWTYRRKMLQANKEAKATLIALALCIAVWTAGGFGLAGSDIEICGTPLWIVGGTVGTWLFAIAAAVFLAKKVFVDFDLDDDADGADTCDGSSAPTADRVASAHASCEEGRHA
ncbi:MAG: YhdT family protein [Slackia sp.]|nr:YhdT family protein [Slackia sp.]